MKKHNLAFIDLETTGFDPYKQEIIQIGCVIAEQEETPKGPKLKIIKEFELKVKPEKLQDADPEALRINGYNEMEWVFATDLKSAIEHLMKEASDCIMVSHNVAFDYSFLQRAFSVTGIQNTLHYHKLDTISIAFAKLYGNPEVRRFSLQALCEYFGIENKQAHTALSDVKAMVELYQKLLGS